MGDEKVKAAKSEKIEVSTLLSIDSPMAIWHTDLDALGLGGGGGSGSSGTEGSSGVTSGGEATSGGETAKPQVFDYIATCDAVPHSVDLVGAAEEGGRWFGVFQHEYGAALEQAQQHEDGLAYVGIYTNGVLVGPVVQH